MTRHQARKPFAGQPPIYVGHRRADPRRGRNVSRDRIRPPSDEELDAAFIAAMGYGRDDGSPAVESS
jgi:hypothetical protein